MPKTVFTILAILLLSKIHGQDIAGTWTGKGVYSSGEAMNTVMTKMGAQKSLLIHIDSAGKITGLLETSFNKSVATLSPENTGQVFRLAGSFGSKDKSLLLIVTHIMEPFDSLEGGIRFTKPDSLYYDLAIQKEKDKWIMAGTINKKLNQNLTGEWIGSSRGTGLGMNISDKLNMHLLPLKIQLEHPVTVQKKETEIAKSDSLPIRKTEIQRTIILDTSFIRIDLYDNGIIDGDIATVLLDGKPVMEKKLLSTVAASISINLSPDPAGHLLELFANNLGSIPPNTALIVLTCKRKRYEINLSSTETVNGGVKLLFKK